MNNVTEVARASVAVAYAVVGEHICLLMRVLADENGPTDRRVERIIIPIGLMGSLFENCASQWPYPCEIMYNVENMLLVLAKSKIPVIQSKKAQYL